jgi:hypothetical protein
MMLKTRKNVLKTFSARLLANEKVWELNTNQDSSSKTTMESTAMLVTLTGNNTIIKNSGEKLSGFGNQYQYFFNGHAQLIPL